MGSRNKDSINFRNLKRKNYFEGWYYKLVSSDGKTIISFIPSFHRNEKESYAMLQCVLGRLDKNWDVTTDYKRYDIKEFSTNKNPFNLKIDTNSFFKDGININFSNSEFEIKGEINFSNMKELPSSFISPDIMGLFSYLPALECIHDIVSLDHKLDGNLNINGEDICFNEGRGYIEKDLGSSFPKYYIWLQSNHFSKRPSSLFFSWADIPFGPTSFDGFICHLWTGDRDIRFATYNMSKCKIKHNSKTSIEVSLENKHYKLKIFAHKKSFVNLEAPIDGLMGAQIKEGLGGEIIYELLNKKSGEILRDKSNLSGVEIMDKLILNKQI